MDWSLGALLLDAFIISLPFFAVVFLELFGTKFRSVYIGEIDGFTSNFENDIPSPKSYMSGDWRSILEEEMDTERANEIAGELRDETDFNMSDLCSVTADFTTYKNDKLRAKGLMFVTAFSALALLPSLIDEFWSSQYQLAMSEITGISIFFITVAVLILYFPIRSWILAPFKKYDVTNYCDQNITKSICGAKITLFPVTRRILLLNIVIIFILFVLHITL